MNKEKQVQAEAALRDTTNDAEIIIWAVTCAQTAGGYPEDIVKSSRLIQSMLKADKITFADMRALIEVIPQTGQIICKIWGGLRNMEGELDNIYPHEILFRIARFTL